MENLLSVPSGGAPGDNPDGYFKHGRKVHAREIAAGELAAWTVFEDSELLVLDKPGDVVCHPSKAGPTSSLVGAIRVHLGLEHPHLVSRLDRETSGLVLVAKTAPMARQLQIAIGRRRIAKGYLAVLQGSLTEEHTVDQPLGDDPLSPVAIKTAVAANGRKAITHFRPLAACAHHTLVRVVPETGRKHQIRAHAQWLGHPVVGDKLYGPDPRHYLEFIETGWTEKLAAALILPRQALHCHELDLREAGVPRVFQAPLPADLREFCRTQGLNVAHPVL